MTFKMIGNGKHICHEPSGKTWSPSALVDYTNDLEERYNELADKILEIERKLNRVTGSIPGDYTWDELVGK